MFWWPLELQEIEEVYFRKILLFSIFNPAFFIRKIESLGLKASFDRNTRQYSFAVSLGNRKVGLDNIGLLLYMIQNHLSSERSIVDMIKLALEKAKNSPGGNVRVNLDMVWRI